MNNFNSLQIVLALGAALVASSAVSQDNAPAAELRPEDSDTSPSGTARPDLPRPPGVDPASQCGGKDEMQDVEKYDGSLRVSIDYVKAFEGSTVQFQWISNELLRSKLPGYDLGNVSGVRWCTGTLIGPTTVLTAGHCFDVQRGGSGSRTPFRFKSDGGREFVVPRDLAKLQTVVFNYQVDGASGLERSGLPFPVVELSEYWRGPVSARIDYAIVEIGRDIEGRLPADYSFAPASLAGSLAPEGATLGIIQHPNGDPKKIEGGGLLRRVGAYIDYNDIDTSPGSSGSGIRNDSGALIGVHIEGGCDNPGGANRGVSIEAIRNVSDRL